MLPSDLSDYSLEATGAFFWKAAAAAEASDIDRDMLQLGIESVQVNDSSSSSLDTSHHNSYVASTDRILPSVGVVASDPEPVAWAFVEVCELVMMSDDAYLISRRNLLSAITSRNTRALSLNSYFHLYMGRSNKVKDQINPLANLHQTGFSLSTQIKFRS